MKTTSFSSGFTPKGQLFVQTKSSAGTLIKTTRNPLRFLQMLLAIPEDPEKEKRRQDSLTPDHEFECCVCHGGFTTGNGAVISDQLFCTPCLGEDKHYVFFLDMGLTGGYVDYLVENRCCYL